VNEDALTRDVFRRIADALETSVRLQAIGLEYRLSGYDHDEYLAEVRKIRAEIVHNWPS
jgi:hypothetical protein